MGCLPWLLCSLHLCRTALFWLLLQSCVNIFYTIPTDLPCECEVSWFEQQVTPLSILTQDEDSRTGHAGLAGRHVLTIAELTTSSLRPSVPSHKEETHWTHKAQLLGTGPATFNPSCYLQGMFSMNGPARELGRMTTPLLSLPPKAL